MPTATPITRQTVGKTFAVAIGILGAGAVLQLGVVCWAFIARFHAPPPPVPALQVDADGEEIPTLARSVPDFSVDPLENGTPGAVAPAQMAKAATPPPKPTPIPAQPPRPPDPGNAERFTELLDQGKMLRERGDTGAALTKFREAQVLDPRNARAIAEIAMTYGKMGLTDREAEQWRRIYDIGETAGVFYAAAVAHLKAAQQETIRSTLGGAAPVETVEPGAPMLELLALASVEARDALSSKKFTLRIPMKARSGAKINVNELTIQVHFYDKVDNSRVERTGANVASRWSTTPADWLESDTEVLEVDFDLPAEKKNRQYYGYLVRLYYKGALQASAGTPEILVEKYPPPAKLQTDSDK